MTNRVKTALFVDFDNIYVGLVKDDPAAAQEFATAPHRWLRWIEEKMPAPTGEDGQPTARSVLVRRCYGNPAAFARFRGYFTRSGFSVVDCPPLTSSAKNSADIVMVMDILDALAHPTRFDEFIIMSGDADFTPLMLRLRMHDRRIAAIVTGNVASAYRAACDLVIPDDTFVDEALEVPEASLPPRALPAVPSVASDVLDAIARRLYEVASANGEVLAPRLPDLYREFRDFTSGSNWLGYFSLRSMTEAVVSRRPELQLEEGDPWRVVVRAPTPAPGAAAPTNGGAPASGAESMGELRTRIVQVVRDFVRASLEPVVMARAAHEVMRALGPRVLDTQWAGAGTFKDLLRGAPDLGLTMVTIPQPGYIFDPERHEAPPTAEPRTDNLAELPDGLANFIRRISSVTGAPRLSPRQYAVLFRLIAKELPRAPYHITTTPNAVRDQVIELGENISRQYITFVLRGITFTGYRFRGIGPNEAPALANAFRGNVLNLLRSAQVVLNEEELALLDKWLLSGTLQSAAAADASGDVGAVPAAEPEQAIPPADARPETGPPTPPPPPEPGADAGVWPSWFAEPGRSAGKAVPAEPDRSCHSHQPEELSLSHDVEPPAHREDAPAPAPSPSWRTWPPPSR